MPAVVVVCVVWFAVVLVVGAVAVSRAPRMSAPTWAKRIRQRQLAAADAAAPVVGRLRVGVTYALAGWAVVVLVGWALGELAHDVEDPIDRPVFRWWRDHFEHGSWATLWGRLTDIGSLDITRGLTVVGAVALLLMFRGRRYWWLPAVTLVVGHAFEHTSQLILKEIVDRGHPPTTLGTWPSGGTARVFVVYGLLIFFVVLRYFPRNNRAWAFGWTLLAIAASIQMYARINNLEHWITDVIGGAIFGYALLAIMITSYRMVTDGDTDGDAPAPARQKRAAAPAA